MNRRKSFRYARMCPVIHRPVDVSGETVSLPGTALSEVIRKSCSHAQACIAAHGALERIPGCLLRELKASSA